MISAENNSSLCVEEHIPAADIRAELVKVRRRASELSTEQSAEKTEVSMPMRVVLANVIVLVSKKNFREREAEVADLIASLCVTHPSRFFVIAFDAAGRASTESGFEATVASRCVRAQSGARVCSEEVYLDVSGDRLEVVPNLLLSLLTADVETTLLVFDDPQQLGFLEPSAREFVCALSKLCDRLLYDSLLCRRYQESVGFFCDSTALARTLDLNWKRTERWRYLLAEQFDAPRFAEAIPLVSSMKFVCNQPLRDVLRGRISADAILMAGYSLASMGLTCEKVFKLEEKAGFMFTTQGESGEGPSLEILSIDSEKAGSYERHAERILRSIKFTLLLGGLPAHIVIEHDPKQHSARIQSELRAATPQEAHCDFLVRSVPFKISSPAELVLSDLALQAPDRMFEEARECSLGIMEAINSYLKVNPGSEKK